MAISLKPQSLKRHRDLARLLAKYGRSDIVREAGFDDALEPGDANDPETPPEARSWPPISRPWAPRSSSWVSSSRRVRTCCLWLDYRIEDHDLLERPPIASTA